MTNYSFKRNPINAKFFDINSNNTFNQYDYFFNQDHEKKEKVFPPWLRLPTYYTTDLWKKVKNTRDSFLLTTGELSFGLECGHEIRIDQRTLLMREHQIRMIYANCSKCGGTGEVKIV